MRIDVGTANFVHLVGHGITVEAEREIAPGVIISPEAPSNDTSFGSRTVGELRETLNVMSMEPLADFSLHIVDEQGGQALAAKTWNALWFFHLLALACRRPVMPLYCAANHGTRFTLANRNLVIHRLPSVAPASDNYLDWATAHFDGFQSLLGENRFQNAVRCYGNAHYLFDDDAKIMLLWAGIEGLLDIDSELRRRIALHAAILLDGTPADKALYFERVKKGYDVRSRVVHGSGAKPEVLQQGYALAGDVLLTLLRKCVELGRVPSAAELDERAASVSLSGGDVGEHS
ncbi:hypothetical protein K7W03_01330 [Sphingobium sp. PNB]|uniref:HEPN domain-containing protein n=1 Tax=Sphingobium sp. PNB TaxID=863934 RepID=UPI001CA43BAC|nr:HEPN domain-containing protein [Sphingobium sp. PNB]MCB4858228.1 hypothetical protein [Sphingobium sp. PNB]